MTKKHPEEVEYEDGMPIQNFDTTAIEKRIFRSRIIELAASLEELLLGLEPYKDLLSDLFSSLSYQPDFFRKIKENPDTKVIRRLIVKYNVVQKEEKKRRNVLSEMQSLWG